jgi:hypothetical protein
MVIVLLVVVGLAAYFVVLGRRSDKRARDAMSPEQRQRYLTEQAARQQELARTREYGPINPAMICPHCRAAGAVRTRLVDRKKGISGGKATAALLTGGVSVLATGLSREELMTRLLWSMWQRVGLLILAGTPLAAVTRGARRN